MHAHFAARTTLLSDGGGALTAIDTYVAGKGPSAAGDYQTVAEATAGGGAEFKKRDKKKGAGGKKERKLRAKPIEAEQEEGKPVLR
jgi:hypothetical protein